MDMTTNRILLTSNTKDPHDCNCSRLSSRHAFHWFVSIVVYINLLEGQVIRLF